MFLSPWSGGIIALVIGHFNLSVSASVGFIALFGVAVLNGIVMVSCFNDLRKRKNNLELAVLHGAELRAASRAHYGRRRSFGTGPDAFCHRSRQRYSKTYGGRRHWRAREFNLVNPVRAAGVIQGIRENLEVIQTLSAPRRFRLDLIRENATVTSDQRPAIQQRAPEPVRHRHCPKAMNATDRDPKGLFLVREIQQENNVADCQNALDAWSANIPFSPIKRFSVQTQFVSATEYAAYKTTVTSQIESRWLQEHEVSYSDQPVPETPVPLSGIDAWKVEFSKFCRFQAPQAKS